MGIQITCFGLASVGVAVEFVASAIGWGCSGVSGSTVWPEMTHSGLDSHSIAVEENAEARRACYCRLPGRSNATAIVPVQSLPLSSVRATIPLLQQGENSATTRVSPPGALNNRNRWRQDREGRTWDERAFHPPSPSSYRYQGSRNNTLICHPTGVSTFVQTLPTLLLLQLPHLAPHFDQSHSFLQLPKSA